MPNSIKQYWLNYNQNELLNTINLSRYRVVRRPPLSARGGTAIQAKLKSSYFYEDSGPDRPRGRGGGVARIDDPGQAKIL